MILHYQERCIRKNGSLFCRDLKIIGETVKNWWRKEGHQVDTADVTDVLIEKPEFFIIGTGYAGQMEVASSLRSALKTHEIELIAEKTPDAVQKFNELNCQGRRIAAAFHLTC